MMFAPDFSRELFVTMGFQAFTLNLLSGKFINELHWFPKAAVTKHHKQGGLKQQKFIVSQFRRLPVQN